MSNQVLDNASPYPSALNGQTLEADAYAPTRRTKNLVLAAAFLGWMFDGLEMGIFPQIAKPALSNLLQNQHLDKAGLDAAI